jgi:3'(2'), 5'-bisphosphate nucleotidase
MTELIDAVVDIAAAAGEEILRIYRTDFDVTAKGDDSPLTLADLNAHRVIVARLAKLTPDVPIVSEESAPPAFDVRSRWSRYWLVDPLDGTREFVGKNGEFTVNIALIDGHRPVIGVVGVPAQDVIFTGDVAALRAERRAGGKCSAIATRRMTGLDNVAVVASRSHGGERLEQYLAALRERFANVERAPVGSSLKLCILAEGKADLYPRLGPTSEWDIAAAQAVLEAAGGRVLEFDGAPLRYNTKASLLNPEFFAIGDPAFAWGDVLPPYSAPPQDESGQRARS